MDQLNAFRDTLHLYRQRATKWHVLSNPEGNVATGCDLEHAHEMLAKIEARPGNFSPAKLGRWLGWLQGSMCALGIITLEEAKEINKRWAD